MRNGMNSLAALITLIAVGLAAAQPPAGGGSGPAKPAPAPAKPDPNSLEAMIAAALKHNPDIAHAEAKVAEANAALNTARLKVMQAVATAHGSLEGAKATLKLTELFFEKQKQLAGAGNVISKLEVDKAELEVQRAKADVVTLEAQLALLQGKGPGHKDLSGISFAADSNRWAPLSSLGFAADGKQLYALQANGSVRLWDPASGQQIIYGAASGKPAAGSMDEKIREALKKTIKIETWKEPLPTADVIEYLKKKAGTDVPFRLLAENLKTNRISPTVDLMAGELPLSAWLTVIEDSVPGLVFVVREYGILVTTRDRMPPDGLPIRMFMQRPEPKKDEPKKP